MPKVRTIDKGQIMHKNFIYLEEYSAEFRQGYDVANVISAMKELLRLFYIDNSTKKLHVCIHKDSLSVCEGVCAENLFHTELKDPEKTDENTKADNEIWLMITPSKMIKH